MVKDLPALAHYKTSPFEEETPFEFDSLKLDRTILQLPHSTPGEINTVPDNPDISHDAMAFNPVTPPTLFERPGGLYTICNGGMAGRSFLLDRPVLTIGRSAECDVVIQDDSVSVQHAQFLCQTNGDYLQDLTSQNGTTVNGEHLNGLLLLQKGDIIGVGNVRLEYTYIPEAQTSSLPPLTLSVSAYPLSGPGPLRLPSKPQ